MRSTSYLMWSLLYLLTLWGHLSYGGDDKNAKPVAQPAVKIVLAGDSTVTNKAGWGGGFAELLSSHVCCVNLAQGGRSSRSFRAEGWWQKCLAERPNYLLIQFGHNDQPGKGIERESDSETAFRDHLREYVREARQIGAQPVLLTSLTRRKWTTEGKIQPTLHAYAAATQAVAAELKVPLIDLHQLSIQQCESLGPLQFRAFEPMSEMGADHTHLNAEGSRAVACLIAEAMMQVVPQSSKFFLIDRFTQYQQLRSAQKELVSGPLRLEQSDHCLTIYQNGRPILVYNKISPPVPDGIDHVYKRSGVLHPVYTPAGHVVTQMFPQDHPHQHGIFSAWVSTRWLDQEIDFWNLAKGQGQVAHQRVLRTFGSDGSVGFEVDLVHQRLSKPVVDVLRERWTITVYATDGSHSLFDLQSHQSALTDQPLTIEKYHYGGVGFRGLVSWLDDHDGSLKKEPLQSIERRPFRMTIDDGSDRLTGNAKHTRWVTASGRLAQAPGQVDNLTATLTVMGHPSNFRAPQAVRLHPTKPYFAFSPCIDGSITIDQQHGLTARYRYLLTDSPPDPSWITQKWDEWISNDR